MSKNKIYASMHIETLLIENWIGRMLEIFAVPIIDSQ